MTQIAELQKQLLGLQARETELTENERLFIKVQGLVEQAEKTRAEITELETDNIATKEILSERENVRAELIKKPLIEMQEVMKTVMPAGKEAIIDITEDNEVRFGVLSTGPDGLVFSPHAGLSGSEQVMFDQALTFALMKNSDHTVLAYESAELSDDTLTELIAALEKEKKAQLLVFSCHTPETKINGKKWNVVQL